MNKKHIYILLLAIATLLLVACPEPTKDKGSTAPPTISKLLGRLAKSVELPATSLEAKKEKQKTIQNLLSTIKRLDPSKKYKPETKGDLIVLIKAEVWAQGTAGAKEWSADLNDIDTSQVTDMAGLFSASNGLDQWTGDLPSWTMPTNRNDIITHENVISRIKNALAKTDGTEKQEDMKTLLRFIDHPTYKHTPKDKAELVAFIKAEIWRQGTGGAKEWSADLNNIDISQVTDMAHLFSSDAGNGQGLHEYIGLPPVWVQSKPATSTGMYTGSLAPLPTWHSIAKLKTEVEKTPPTQAIIQTLIKEITKDNPDYKHTPKDTAELVTIIKAEIWAQGTKGAQKWDADLNNIDTSQVTDMAGLFGHYYSKKRKSTVGYGLRLFNGDISNWDVSSVTNMFLMFYTNLAFNCDISKWKTKNVKDMQGMFGGAWAFNQPLNDWDVSSVTNMFYMFFEAKAFNQPLNKWKVGNVTDMAGLFNGAKVFNQDLNDWDVSSVTTMQGMFNYAQAFNQPLNKWKVGKVKNMKMMFFRAFAFNQDLDQWDVSSVTNFENMFFEAKAFNKNLDAWDEHLQDGENNYRKIKNKQMFFNSGITTPPQWLNKI